ncbi:MAG: DUF1801 domain-containing protein [Candidatus Sericytochromatia bacterium]
MSKSNYKNNSLGVNNYIENSKPEIKDLLQEIRETILESSNEIDEYIKWNSPSFFYKGFIREFNPKEYKRDLIVFNIRKEVMLVLPTGNIINDTSGLLQGNFKDSRKIIIFKDITDFRAKKAFLKQIIIKWINLIDT